MNWREDAWDVLEEGCLVGPGEKKRGGDVILFQFKI